MKLTVTFLLIATAVAFSETQKFVWPKHYAIRHVFWPFIPYLTADSDPAMVIDAGELDPFNSAKDWDQSIVDSRNRASGVQQRRFGLPPLYRTTTTITSSVLTAVISSCIPASQFSTGGSPPQLSTNPCGRKKRDAKFIKPSPVDRMISSAVQTMQADPIETELWSSRDLWDQQDDDLFYHRGHRAFNVLYTYTSILYVFNSTVIKKTVNLGNNQQLLCLPYGFTVC